MVYNVGLTTTNLHLGHNVKLSLETVNYVV